MLAECAAEAGLPRQAVIDFLAGDLAREEMRAADQAAREAGVSGVPSFFLDGYSLFSGAMPADTIAERPSARATRFCCSSRLPRGKQPRCKARRVSRGIAGRSIAPWPRCAERGSAQYPRSASRSSFLRQMFTAPELCGYSARQSRTRKAHTMSSKHPETLALHAGWRRDSATNAVAVPIYQTTSYQFDSAEHAANLFALKELGQHLHPHHEPDQRRAGAAARGDRGRRGGAGPGVRPGGVGVLGAEPGARRRQHRQLHRPVWRHLEPVRQHAEGPGHRGALRRSRPIPRRSPAPPTTAPAPITPRRCRTRS